jgi:hypothetical protein
VDKRKITDKREEKREEEWKKEGVEITKDSVKSYFILPRYLSIYTQYFNILTHQIPT